MHVFEVTCLVRNVVQRMYSKLSSVCFDFYKSRIIWFSSCKKSYFSTYFQIKNYVNTSLISCRVVYT